MTTLNLDVWNIIKEYAYFNFETWLLLRLTCKYNYYESNQAMVNINDSKFLKFAITFEIKNMVISILNKIQIVYETIEYYPIEEMTINKLNNILQAKLFTILCEKEEMKILDNIKKHTNIYYYNICYISVIKNHLYRVFEWLVNNDFSWDKEIWNLLQDSKFIIMNHILKCKVRKMKSKYLEILFDQYNFTLYHDYANHVDDPTSIVFLRTKHISETTMIINYKTFSETIVNPSIELLEEYLFHGYKINI